MAGSLNPGNMDQSAKKLIAAKASLDFVKDGMVLGVGTGSTVNHLIDLLPAVKNKLDAVVSSSADSKARLEENGFEVTRADETYGPGLIIADIERQLIDAKAIIGSDSFC